MGDDVHAETLAGLAKGAPERARRFLEDRGEASAWLELHPVSGVWTFGRRRLFDEGGGASSHERLEALAWEADFQTFLHSAAERLFSARTAEAFGFGLSVRLFGGFSGALSVPSGFIGGGFVLCAPAPGGAESAWRSARAASKAAEALLPPEGKESWVCRVRSKIPLLTSSGGAPREDFRMRAAVCGADGARTAFLARSLVLSAAGGWNGGGDPPILFDSVAMEAPAESAGHSVSACGMLAAVRGALSSGGTP